MVYPSLRPTVSIAADKPIIVTLSDHSLEQGRIWRAFRALPGRPWRRTQDSVGH